MKVELRSEYHLVTRSPIGAVLTTRIRDVDGLTSRMRRSQRGNVHCQPTFTNPHDPWEVRRRHWDVYRDDEIDLPAVGPIPRAEADPHSVRLRDMSGIDERPLTGAEVRHARHGYYAPTLATP